MKQTSKLQSRPTKPFHYAVGMFGTSIPINMFKTFAFIFYVDHLSALTAEKFALILAVYVVLDAADNPIYGFLSDGTRSPWGRRRPWLVIGAPLLALCFILFFNVPAFLSEGSVFWYALVMYMLTGTLDSLINANYGALFPELFTTEKERAKTNALRQAFQLLAMIISIALTPMIADKIGYSKTALAYSVLAVSVILYMAFNCHETPEAQELPKPQLFKTILAIARNPKFWLYGFANAAFFAALAVLQQSVSFFTKYVLQTEGMATTILMAAVIVVAILAIPVWVQIVKKLHLMKAWRLSLLLVALTLIPLYFTGTLLASTVALVFVGFSYGGVCVTMDIVGARILDEDKALHGVQREGTFASLTGILNKTSGLFAAIGFLLVSRIYGYESGDVPGPQPAAAGRFLVSIFPFAIMLVCCLLSLFLRFQDNETQAGEPEEAAEQPVTEAYE